MKRPLLISVLSVAALTAGCQRGYFPGVDLQASARDWYQVRLKAMDELPLGPRSPDTIRVVYFGSFDNLLCFRLARDEQMNWQLTTKVTDGRGGGAPGILRVSASRYLRSDELKLVMEGLERTGLGQPPADRKGLGIYTTVLDGCICLLEQVEQGQYHMRAKGAYLSDTEVNETRNRLESLLQEWEHPPETFVAPDGRTWVREPDIENGELMGYSEFPLIPEFTRSDFEEFVALTLIPERRIGELIAALCGLSAIPEVRAWNGANGDFNVFAPAGQERRDTE